MDARVVESKADLVEDVEKRIGVALSGIRATFEEIDAFDERPPAGRAWRFETVIRITQNLDVNELVGRLRAVGFSGIQASLLIHDELDDTRSGWSDGYSQSYEVSFDARPRKAEFPCEAARRNYLVFMVTYDERLHEMARWRNAGNPAMRTTSEWIERLSEVVSQVAARKQSGSEGLIQFAAYAHQVLQDRFQEDTRLSFQRDVEVAQAKFLIDWLIKYDAKPSPQAMMAHLGKLVERARDEEAQSRAERESYPTAALMTLREAMGAATAYLLVSWDDALSRGFTASVTPSAVAAAQETPASPHPNGEP